MVYDLVTNIRICPEITRQLMHGNVDLLYYSHIPAMLVSFLMGLFVLRSSNKGLVARVFFAFTTTFSLWTFLNLLTWFSFDSRVIMFSWSLLGILSVLLYELGLYFVYVFIDDKDISFFRKVFLGLLILPIIIFTPTKFNLASFYANDCTAIDNLFLYYVYIPQVITTAWMIVFAIKRYLRAEKKARKQIVLLILGILFFLGGFFWVGVIADVFQMYSMEVYGVLGMPIFLGLLTYLIVRYKAFNIKFMAVQALVIILIILVASEFFFVQSLANQILTGVTFLLTVIFGMILINSVKADVKRREELQGMADKLAKANDDLRKLDNSKSEFISIAAHQLRTPLTAVKGFVSLLLDGTYGKVNAKHREVLDKVYLNGERLINLVEDMLDVSRIESGRMEYAYAKADIVAVCKEVADTFVLRAKKRKLFIKIKNPKENIPLIMTDRSKIVEVISNVIDNAIKYTDKGGITIELSKDDSFVNIAIKDTGIGIPQEELPYLFAKFSRGKDTSRLNATGTGLGLHVSRSMVEAMGGKVTVTSQGAGKGSTFIIHVPVERE